jgi:cyclopropane fatty-acyl-phospholipid synthase-like methyltransferase
LIQDPKRFGFMFARHKFVAKMLDGCKSVLEIGCQEGIGTLCVSKSVAKITAIDFYKPHIEAAIEGMQPVVSNATFFGHDMLDGPVDGVFDAAFALDVFEHIDPKQSDQFFKNIIASLEDYATLVIGIPSLESQRYASKAAAAGHINCMSGPDLKAFCQRYFHNVFMFGMNDEVLHTGFMPMCHYLFAMCVSPKR